MIKYGYEVIRYDNFGSSEANFINTYYRNRQGNIPLVVQVENTKKIDKTSLNLLNDNVMVSIIGPYTETSTISKAGERNFLNTLYDKNEVGKIISEFEKIEKDIASDWNQYDILVYLIDKITSNVMYDPEYYLLHLDKKEIPIKTGTQDMADYHDRTLRGILSRKTVCAGFAVILKELANRNGIDCSYVSGKTKSGGGHAWNLVTINGKIHPLDITWKNTKYRKGDFTNIENISCDVEKFKQAHFPKNLQHNIGLVKIDEDVVKEAKLKTSIRKNYTSTSFLCRRKDETKFRVTQIGTYKGLFRYLYNEINADNSLNTTKILFSGSNLFKNQQDHEFKKISDEKWDEFISSFVNVLFSKENINDSRKKKTKYIGECEKIDGSYCKTPTEITKTTEAISKFKLDFIKSTKRSDGTLMTVVQTANNLKNDGSKYKYHIYTTSTRGKVFEYAIYSDDNYFSMKPSKVANELLSANHLESALSNNGKIKK